LDPTGKIKFVDGVAAKYIGVTEALRAVSQLVLENLAQKA
jgi:hypothetical protein